LASFKPRGLDEHVIVAMMTRHVSGLGFPHDVSVVDWQKAGLPKPTLVRLAKVVTLDRKLVKRKLGRLPKTDQQSIVTKFKELFLPLLS
jgi:mRNA interferase MazF